MLPAELWDISESRGHFAIWYSTQAYNDFRTTCTSCTVFCVQQVAPNSNVPTSSNVLECRPNERHDLVKWADVKCVGLHGLQRHSYTPTILLLSTHPYCPPGAVIQIIITTCECEGDSRSLLQRTWDSVVWFVCVCVCLSVCCNWQLHTKGVTKIFHRDDRERRDHFKDNAIGLTIPK